MEPRELFEKMFAYYGPQNWWPGEGFEIAIGAILTQNTSWANVEKALANLKANNILTPEKILTCDDELLLQLIKSTGFYNQKAHYLKNLCELWIRNPKPSRKALLSVKGIGDETADSILLYLLSKAEFVIDAYTIRISRRIGFSKSYNKKFWKDFYMSKLDKDVQMFNEFHALFVEHGKRFCRKKDPLCCVCFLNTDCNYGKKAINRD